MEDSHYIEENQVEAEAAYLRQGFEVALSTPFVDVESAKAHAQHILDTCNGGLLMLGRFRHQIERNEALEYRLNKYARAVIEWEKLNGHLDSCVICRSGLHPRCANYISMEDSVRVWLRAADLDLPFQGLIQNYTEGEGDMKFHKMPKDEVDLHERSE